MFEHISKLLNIITFLLITRLTKDTLKAILKQTLMDNDFLKQDLDETESKVTNVGFKVSEENANIGIQRVIVDRARSIEVPSIAGEAN